jgi:hypothetical protein
MDQMSVPFFECFLTATSLLQAGNETFRKEGQQRRAELKRRFHQLGPFRLADAEEERVQDLVPISKAACFPCGGV